MEKTLEAAQGLVSAMRKYFESRVGQSSVNKIIGGASKQKNTENLR
jgi:hypothetical protein